MEKIVFSFELLKKTVPGLKILMEVHSAAKNLGFGYFWF